VIYYKVLLAKNISVLSCLVLVTAGLKTQCGLYASYFAVKYLNDANTASSIYCNCTDTFCGLNRLFTSANVSLINTLTPHNLRCIQFKSLFALKIQV